MIKRSVWMLTACIVILLLSACATTKPPKKLVVGSEANLLKHSQEFKKGVIEVADGVHVAIGFGLANSELIVGTDGVIIIDTMESEEAAIPVKEAFSRITEKPVKAIIYTHYHSDHTFGATVMKGDDNPDIYSYVTTRKYLERIITITRDITYKRAMRMFGNFLPEGGVINDGIGPFLKYDKDKTAGVLLPTKTFSGDEINLNIAGVKLKLVHAPGETNDQIFVWLPEKKVLFCADNFYKAFPNLYTIRGTAPRDVMDWVHSLDRMRSLRAEYLIPSHTRPIVGAEKIYETLTNYRDAIQFVHDQTIRGMNKGLTPDELIGVVKLPQHLADKPYLKEYYGTVAFSVKGIFDGYLGWFGGNPTDLRPLPPYEEAQHFALLAGGADKLLEHARKAVSQGDYEWALVLTEKLIELKPEDKEVKELRARALTELGSREINAPARNYYLTSALEAQGRLHIGGVPPTRNKDLVHRIPLNAIFNSMAVRLNPQKSMDVNKCVGFRFPDTGQAYTVHVRSCVAEIQPRFPDNPDMVVTVDSDVWKELAAEIRNPVLALAKGDIKVKGGLINLVKFLDLFKD